MYYRRGLQVMLVRGDLEFGPLKELVKQLPSVPDLDLASKEEHVGDIKRNIRYLKEKFRQLRHTLPFKQIPNTRSHYFSNGASMHDDVEYVPSKGRQLSLFAEHDSDKQRSVNGPVKN